MTTIAFNPMRFGNVVTDISVLPKLPARVRSIKSWDNSRMNSATGQAVMALRATPEAIRAPRYWIESVHAGKGIYVLFVIPFSLDGITDADASKRVNECRVACFDLLANS